MTKKMNFLSSLMIVSVLGVSSQTAPSRPSSSVKDMLMAANLTALVDSLVANKLDDVLNATGPVTIFAPSNEAFQAMMDNKPDMVKGFSGNSTMFKRFLHYHVVPRKLMPTDIRNDMTVASLRPDKQLRFNVYGNANKKIMTVNGVMFMEPTVVSNNIVVYKLNNFLLCAMGGGIFDLLQLSYKNQPDRFSLLIQAIQLTNLTDTLEKGGPFTLFAPTNDAFKALPTDSYNRLLATPAELKMILLGHVVSGTYFLSGLTSGDLATMDGRSNRIAIGTGALTVDGAKLNVQADMLAVNGVVHVIDRVLLS